MTEHPPVRDHTRISLFDLLEVRYGCKCLGITEARLREAVRESGSREVCRVSDYMRASG